MLILVENSSRILRAGFGVESAKSTLFDIVDLVRGDRDLESELIQLASKFLLSAEPGADETDVVPLELLELAAYELRLNELMDLAMNRVNKRFGGDMMAAAGDAAMRIMHAARDDWEGRDIFERDGQ